jgi:hypothetical protein
MTQRMVSLGEVRHLVLDEADRLLDMGFIADIRRIVADLPRARQSLLFSATMSGEIAELANSLPEGPGARGSHPGSGDRRCHRTGRLSREGGREARTSFASFCPATTCVKPLSLPAPSTAPIAWLGV